MDSGQGLFAYASGRQARNTQVRHKTSIFYLSSHSSFSSPISDILPFHIARTRIGVIRGQRSLAMDEPRKQLVSPSYARPDTECITRHVNDRGSNQGTSASPPPCRAVSVESMKHRPSANPLAGIGFALHPMLAWQGLCAVSMHGSKCPDTRCSIKS
ncbi:hypothetical protein BDZ85DRAFT_104947 [Elsinoe ampelina]|uniref:Uncharacterized protein n=1 Tax=Elsinoe ampelina TaxID=302913 RepID=A0A6A6FY05_9PEZI|nr:hypothetical protein BDZ85DRAFT_104947 [Elsinoe ampelina]